MNKLKLKHRIALGFAVTAITPPIITAVFLWKQKILAIILVFLGDLLFRSVARGLVAKFQNFERRRFNIMLNVFVVLFFVGLAIHAYDSYVTFSVVFNLLFIFILSLIAYAMHIKKNIFVNLKDGRLCNALAVAFFGDSIFLCVLFMHYYLTV